MMIDTDRRSRHDRQMEVVGGSKHAREAGKKREPFRRLRDNAVTNTDGHSHGIAD